MSRQDSHFLEKYIRTLDPSIFGLPRIHAISLSPLTTGHQNINFILQLNNESDKKFVLRYNPNPIDRYERTEAEYEKLLQLQGLHAPKAIYLGKPDFLNSALMIMEYVVGEHKEFSKLTHDQIGALARAVADLHSITSNSFSASPGAPADMRGSQYDYLQASIESTINARLEKADPSVYAGDEDLLQRARDTLAALAEKYKDAFSENEFSLLHLDIIPPNVLWSGKGITFVDWVALSYGDRAEEVAYIFAINNLDEQFHKSFLDAYQKYIVDKTLEQRILVYMLKHKLFDLAWSITMVDEESRGMTLLSKGSYRSFYKERLKSLKRYMREMGYSNSTNS